METTVDDFVKDMINIPLKRVLSTEDDVEAKKIFLESLVDLSGLVEDVGRGYSRSIIQFLITDFVLYDPTFEHNRPVTREETIKDVITSVLKLVRRGVALRGLEQMMDKRKSFPHLELFKTLDYLGGLLQHIENYENPRH